MKTDGAVATQTPLALVGIGCRFPGGAKNPAALWRLLENGVDATTEVPPERWSLHKFYNSDPNQPGKMYVKRGGFLKEPIDHFDAQFFGISPREAACMDPQQRLLLEVTWEALEDAGIPTRPLEHTDVGVFIGGFCTDALVGNLGALNRNLINASTAVGSTLTLLSNRISYAFNFQGPSLSIDTACSSSLVALHVACRSLWAGDCSMALVGGVNVMLRPESPILMCKGHFLSPDGRCKSFDERADGYGRAEGAGIVVLKPLPAALENGDRIYSVVRATAVNQDGRTNGITVPNQVAQETLIRRVCDQAGVSPSQVGYVETHGTGTPIGDPIEARAIGAVVGKKRREACLIGSIKANMGHLEAASGVAGLIKASLCLTHRKIPPQIHLENPNPAIPFKDLGLRLPRKLEPMPHPQDTGSAFAAVNSFGYGGTNAHALLEEAPSTKALTETIPSPEQKRSFVLPLSARSEGALRDLAKSYLTLINAGAPPRLADLCYSASIRRDHHNYRKTFVAKSSTQLAAQLSDFTESDQDARPISNQDASKLVFVYTGMGPQWWGMGNELLEREPAYRKAVESCDAEFQCQAGWSILAEMNAAEKMSRMTETQIAQPANFVLQVGLTALWRSWGIEPAAVVGHSVGEVAAAYISGALSLKDAITISLHRSRLQQRAAGKGKMLAVGLPEQRAREALSGRETNISIAAVNSHSGVTLAGDPFALDEFAEEMEQAGIFHRLLQVEVAYHSPHMDPLKKDLLKSLAGIRPRKPLMPVYSTVTGALIEDRSFDPEYWFRNIRQPVQFAATMDRILEDGYQLFAEVGPHPVLSASIKEAFTANNQKAQLVASLRRPHPKHPKKLEPAMLLNSMAALHDIGYPVDWKRYYAAHRARFVPLPTYAWQRDPYPLLESDEALADRLGSQGNPLLERRLSVPGFAWESDLSEGNLPYLNDHRVHEMIVFPGAAYVETCLAAAEAAFERDACVIEDLQFQQMLVLAPGEEPVLHAAFDKKTRQIKIQSRSHNHRGDHGAWALHANGRLTDPRNEHRTQETLDAVRNRCGEKIEIKALYKNFEARGLRYGPAFQTIKELWSGHEESLAQIQVAEGSDADRFKRYRMHPTILDGCFQALLGAMGTHANEEPEVFVPVRIAQLRFNNRIGPSIWSHARLTSRSGTTIEGDIILFDKEGKLLAEVLGVRCQALPAKSKEAIHTNELSYRTVWQEISSPLIDPQQATGSWLIFQNHDQNQKSVGILLQDHLKRQGAPCMTLNVDESLLTDETPIPWIEGNAPDLKRTVLEHASRCRGIIYLNSQEAPLSDEDPMGTQQSHAWLKFMQALTATPMKDSAPRLYLVTREAQPVAGALKNLPQVPMLGLAQVAANEYPHLRLTSLDMGGLDGPDSAARLLANEVLADDDEREVAYREGFRYVRRLEHSEPEQARIAPEGTPFRLECATPGVLDTLKFRETTRRAPGPGEVEIEIYATALNYKDVLKAMGHIPEKALENTFWGAHIGMEASGRVARVGPGVIELRVGDEVAGAIPGCFRSFGTVQASTLFPFPKLEHISHPENAGLPVIFVTAYYALHEIARIRPGEKILIHGAAGGVGMAAIQYAKMYGAEIFASAGNPEKREYLLSLGVKHVMDSRSLDFVDQIKDLTDGQGVDVVLNSVSGETLTQSFALLAPFGRFIEMGKRDIVEDRPLSMLPFNRNLTFAAIDIDRMMIEDPNRFHRLEKDVWNLFQSKSIVPIPIKVFAANEVTDAFRYMAMSKHIGKIIVSMRGQQVPLLPMEAGEQPLFRSDASYLITGGFGGFGLELAKWMADEGARHLVLTGRRGAVTREARQTVNELEKAGVRVLAEASDVSQAEAVRTLLNKIADDPHFPPLRGIMHSAMVLDDVILEQMTPEQFEKVMGPKAKGAWHLHQQTLNLPLDHFVLFSSISSLIGNPGQGNYVAANAFLDALAHFRRAKGYCGMSVNWGVLADVGVAARDPKVLEHLKRIGLGALKPDDALRALGKLMRSNPVQEGVFDVNWNVWSKTNLLASSAPFFKGLIKQEDHLEDNESMDPLQILRNADSNTKIELAEALMAEQVAMITQIPVDRVDLHLALNQLGIDSLMLIELQMALQREFDVPFSPQELAKGNLASAAELLLEKLGMPSTA